MQKQELLKELSEKIRAGEIQPEELMPYMQGMSVAQPKARTEENKFSVSKILYLLGGVIVVIGIIFFVSQIWNDIGSVGRIGVTLGLGFLFTALGVMLQKSRPSEHIASVFYFIGGMLIPGGAMVTLSELSVDSVSLWPVAITFGAIFGFYLLLNFVQKNAVLTFFTVANGTAFLYLVIESILDERYYQHGDLYAYVTMIVGISYLLLANAFQYNWNKPLVGVLHFFGSAGFFAAAFSQVDGSIPWQLFYFPLVVGGLYLSVYMRSRAILAMSTLFLVVHVSYITSEYFADSIGWPISLVLLGFLFIGLGYVSISINKKYIARKG